MSQKPPEPDATGAYVPATPIVPAERFVPGTLLAARYRVVSALGRGGMGEVYRADDLKLGQAVALKFLPALATGGAERLERFYNEARMAREVSHPTVCRVHDIGEQEGMPFLVAECLEGRSLRERLKAAPMAVSEAVSVAQGIAQGLAAAEAA